MDDFVFISDLHLDDNHPAQFAAFTRLVDTLERGQQLIILGDLFNAWYGDTKSQAAMEVISQLRDLDARGVRVSMMRGNRDFLIDENFVKKCGARLLPDPYRLVIHGKSVILTHGDDFCTLDESYLKFKRKIQSPFIYKLNRVLPMLFKRWIANALRRLSSKQAKHKSMQMMDVYGPTVDACFSHQDADLIIHGHTHRPALHVHNVNGRQRERYVLGAWDVKPVILRITGGGEFRLCDWEA
jgi:UDP-2,3-diacylglucosamine hydrolase